VYVQHLAEAPPVSANDHPLQQAGPEAARYCLGPVALKRSRDCTDCVVEPQAGRHLTHATRDRKAPRFVAALQRIARRYRTATTIHLIMDNLNLHGASALLSTLGAKQGAALWARFTPHYTPKHGSWLNPAEIEASLWARECHGRDRVDTFEALRDRTRAWTARADRRRRAIIWRFTTAKARRVFRWHCQVDEKFVPCPASCWGRLLFGARRVGGKFRGITLNLTMPVRPLRYQWKSKPGAMTSATRCPSLGHLLFAFELLINPSAIAALRTSGPVIDAYIAPAAAPGWLPPGI
jgi:transposase